MAEKVVTRRNEKMFDAYRRLLGHRTRNFRKLGVSDNMNFSALLLAGGGAVCAATKPAGS